MIITSSHDLISYLVVDLLIKILNKNVALAGLAEGGIALGPHDPATDRG
jgi:hypothetical protein